MRLILVFFSMATILGVAAPARAQPSFDCGANLNATERAICNDPGLAALDQDMASRFYAVFNRLEGDRQAALRNGQTEWLHNRNACGAAVGCIRANYVYRIGQIEATDGGGSGPVRQSSVTVLPDGTMERRTEDGGLIRRLPNGRTERYAPDGSRIPTFETRANVQPSTLPPLPQPLAGWGEALEASLLLVLDNLLSDPEYQAYLSTESDKDDYGLIDWRLRSITFLTRP